MLTEEAAMSQQNICTTSLDQLKEVFIKDLKKEQIEPNQILWLKAITNPFKLFDAITLIVEDKE